MNNVPGLTSKVVSESETRAKVLGVVMRQLGERAADG